MSNKCIIFDLDDTLIYEFDYLKSAFNSIAKKIDKTNNITLEKKMLLWQNNNTDVFGEICKEYSHIKKDDLVYMYRNHFPKLSLIDGAANLIKFLIKKQYILGLITDGYSITQRNKLKAINIDTIFNSVIISEEFGSNKFSIKNFEFFLKYKCDQYYYIGDNPKKDFFFPNKLKWITICLLDKGKNIHKQNFNLPHEFLPKFCIQSFNEILNIIEN